MYNFRVILNHINWFLNRIHTHMLFAQAVVDLLKRGIRDNLEDGNGECPVHVYAKRKDFHCLMALLLHGNSRSVNITNKDGRTALHIAVEVRVRAWLRVCSLFENVYVHCLCCVCCIRVVCIAISTVSCCVFRWACVMISLLRWACMYYLLIICVCVCVCVCVYVCVCDDGPVLCVCLCCVHAQTLLHVWTNLWHGNYSGHVCNKIVLLNDAQPQCPSPSSSISYYCLLPRPEMGTASHCSLPSVQTLML